MLTSRSIKEKTAFRVKRFYELYMPNGWLQIYYPLFYLGRAIRHDGETQSEKHRKNLLRTVPAAVAFIILWIFCINAQFLSQHVRGTKGMSSRSLPPVGHGFSQREATQRRALHGPNEIRLSRDWLYIARYLVTHSVSVPLGTAAVAAFVSHDRLHLIVILALLAWHIGILVHLTNDTHWPAPPTETQDMPDHVAGSGWVVQAVSKLTLATMLIMLILASTVSKPLDLHGFLQLAFGVAVMNVTTGRDAVLQSVRTNVLGRIAKETAIVNGRTNSAEALAGTEFVRADKTVQLSGQLFQQVRTYLMCRTALGLHLSLIMFGSYMIYGTLPARLQWFIVMLYITDVIGTQLSYDDGRTPSPRKPPRWRSGKDLGMIITLTVILTAGSYFTTLATPYALDDEGITLAQMTVFLGAALTDNWLCLLLLTNGRFWTHISRWTSLWFVLVFEIPTRLSYFGWAGETSMNAGVAARLWLISLAVLGASAAVCWLAADGELVHRRTVCEEQESSRDGDRLHVGSVQH